MKDFGPERTSTGDPWHKKRYLSYLQLDKNSTFPHRESNPGRGGPNEMKTIREKDRMAFIH